MKTIPVENLSTIKMTTGGEKRHPLVIHEGMVKQWVGFGWVTERKATKADRTKIPEAK